MWIIGHRGSAGTHPENTLASVGAALAAGADWIEVDVYAAAGELLVIHDDTLDRTTDGRGALTDKSLEALRALDAGGGERIPLLAEVMDLIDARAGLNIEIKNALALDPVLALVAARLASRPAWHGRVLLSSFMPDVTAALGARARDGWLLGVLYLDDARDPVAIAAGVQAYSLHPPLRQVDATLVGAAHAAGLRVFAYTVNEPAAVERCLALGIDGIYTDHPGRAIAIRAAYANGSAVAE
ncbi:MAG: glycerophosphoryl diester phosphodiesterase [Gammaproteobacteria bacterium]|nr:glycerophosphoryl diester phosphodiesterase [Gammaproteobacteria bacterium]